MAETKQFKSVLQYFYEEVRAGRIKSFVPLLAMYQISGKTMTLRQHYQFAPMYNIRAHKKQLWMTGRQVGKSFGLSSSIALKCSTIPYFHTMIVQPRADQIQRLNNTVLKPLLESSPASDQLISRPEINKMALKQFKSGSLLYMDYCFVSPDRLRGASGLAQIVLDQCQDIEYDFISIIEQATAHSQNYGYSLYTGTPKTTDTTLSLLWDKSSKAEWIIKCSHCGQDNIPNPEAHLFDMLGSKGLICHKCGRQLHEYDGHWVHAYGSRSLEFPGYHLPQVIHPFHLDPNKPQRWHDLMNEVKGYKKMSLYNEILGWPYDESTSPLILKNLLDAQHDITVNTPQDLEAIRNNYRMISVGVDWSGGAALSDSYTAISIAGLRTDSNVIDILYGKRFAKFSKPFDEAKEVLQWVQQSGADILAHDNSGPGGNLRMEIMKQLGLLNLNCIAMPFTYVGGMKGDIIRFHPATRDDDLYYYSLDKARSLSIMIQALKDCRIRIPKFRPEDSNHFNYDYLALRQDPRETPGNNVVMYIIKKPGVPDDHAHATNFAVSALWDRCHAYPKLGTPMDVSKLSAGSQQALEQIQKAEQIYGPRNDFKRFIDQTNNHPQVIIPSYNPWQEQ